jgi:hypothetical protein
MAVESYADMIISRVNMFLPRQCSCVANLHVYAMRGPVTRVNSTNVLDEGLRIGEIGRRMNSKVKLFEIGVYRK